MDRAKRQLDIITALEIALDWSNRDQLDRSRALRVLVEEYLDFREIIGIIAAEIQGPKS